MKIELGQVQKMLEWLKTKLYLDSIAQNARSRAVKRGQVYRCNFGCGRRAPRSRRYENVYHCQSGEFEHSCDHGHDAGTEIWH